MDQQLRDRLHAFYQACQAHDAQQVDRRSRWRNLEPESALLLAILVRSKQAKRALEIGTSNGFSTLWLADALKATGGFLTSLDIDARRTDLARGHLRQFGLDEQVQCLTADAAHFLAQPHQPYDFIFLDAERGAYESYWPALRQLIDQQPGALLLVDNVLSHQGELSGFLATVRTDDSVITSTIAVGAGLLMVVKT